MTADEIFIYINNLEKERDALMTAYRDMQVMLKEQHTEICTLRVESEEWRCEAHELCGHLTRMGIEVDSWQDYQEALWQDHPEWRTQ